MAHFSCIANYLLSILNSEYILHTMFGSSENLLAGVSKTGRIPSYTLEKYCKQMLHIRHKNIPSTFRLNYIQRITFIYNVKRLQ